MNVIAQKLQSQNGLVCKSSAWSNHRTTLPQSRPAGVTAPSEREPGWGGFHSTGYSLMSGVTGDFHRPYESSEIFTFHHSLKYTPSVTPDGRDSSLREGAGNGLHHSTGYSLKSQVTGDFHRPYGGAVPFDRRGGIGDEILYHFPREGSRGNGEKGL